MRSRSSLLTLLTVASILTGCTVGPNFHRPCCVKQKEWILTDDEKILSTTDHLADWWTVFDDPVLDELIQVARNQNLDLRIACYRIQEARALYRVALGEYFPQTQEGFGSASQNQISKNTANTTPNVDFNYQSYDLGFRAAWELDVWGRFQRGIEAAQADLCFTIADYQDVLVILFGDVASTYVSMRSLEERLHIVRSNLKLQARSLEISEARFKGGFVTELDVTQATVLLKSTEARIPQLEAQIRGAKNALATLLGMTPDHIDEYLCDPGKIPQAGEEVTAGVPCELLNRRPDVRSALHLAHAQSARVGIAFSDLFPRFSLTGSIGYLSSGSITASGTGGGGSLFDAKSFGYNYAGQFVWPILNYGRLTNRVRAEEARLCQLTTAYCNTVLLAFQEVENGMVAFIKAQEQADTFADGVKAAQRSVELANKQYVEGLADYTRVLTTQQAQLEQEEQYALAREDIAQGLISTYRALGGGWECPRDSDDRDREPAEA